MHFIMSSDITDHTQTSFGFRDVTAKDKPKLVRGVFDSVARQYDVMNDLMSGGIHRVWKSTFLDRLAPQPGRMLLDMAGGTGDIAAGFLQRADERPNIGKRPPAEAIVCDINFEMLRAGMDRPALTRSRAARLCADAENIPLPDNSVDQYTIAFGIRNVTDIPRALREAYRVLKPGGRFSCLEFSHPVIEPMQKIYDQYSFNVIPWLGEQAVGDRESYQYLVESIRRFPKQRAFASMIEDAKFARTTVENLTGGVAAIHSGAKI